MNNKNKKWTDVIAMAFMICAIITGFMLHHDVHHLHFYKHPLLWNTHIISGLIVVAALIFHCIQHKFWFRNYAKIPAVRKGVTTILFVVAILVAVTGIILVSGSHSKFVSIFHYITAIVLTLLAITHVAQRWKIFKSLFK